MVFATNVESAIPPIPSVTPHLSATVRSDGRPHSTGAEARNLIRRLAREIGSHWPRVEIRIRADSHYCAPEVLDFCRAARIDFLLGVATTTTLRRHVETLEASTARRHTGAPGVENSRGGGQVTCYPQPQREALSASRSPTYYSIQRPAHCSCAERCDR